MKRNSGYHAYLKSPETNIRAIPRQTTSNIRRRKIILNAERIESADEFDPFSNMPQNMSTDDLDLSSESESCSSFHYSAGQMDENYIYKGSNLKVSESALLIYAFSVRHGLSKSATSDLLDLINLHLPSGSTIPRTNYQLMKKLEFDRSSVETHLYCRFCESYIGFGEISNLCGKCGREFCKKGLVSEGSFFISFNPKWTIAQTLSHPKIGTKISQTFATRKVDTGFITNVYDGKCYKDLKLGEHDLTCLFNSDGVPVFKSSKFSLWPILYSINEMEYELGRNNILTLGLWFGTRKPNFDTFLQPFIKDLRDLSTIGISWNCNGNRFHSKIYFPMVVTDSVARPMLQGLHQFNGSYGCTWCLCKGKSVTGPTPKSHKWIYNHLTKNMIKPRTKVQFIEHLSEFEKLLGTDKTIRSHFGVKSASKLLLFPKFDIINGFVFDYMHTTLLGICRTFTGLWLDSKNHKKSYYIGTLSASIDKQLLRCLVPFNFGRSVRSISERAFWKASEWRTWAFVNLIVLDNILPDLYLRHFAKFVHSLMILCSDKIAIADINFAEDCLISFVMETETLYGEYNCNYNVHLLLHAAECVRNWGPLSFYSAFQFENYNGVLLRLFKGAYKVPVQISNNILQMSQIPQIGLKVLKHASAHLFFSDMFHTHKYSQSTHVDMTTLLVGKRTLYIFETGERQKLININISDTQGFSYSSCLVHGNFYSVQSKTTTRRNNSVFQYKNNFYVIRRFVLLGDGGAYALSAKIHVEFVQNCPLAFIVTRINTHKLKFIPTFRFQNVKFLVITNEQKNMSHIIKIPNTFEME